MKLTLLLCLLLATQVVVAADLAPANPAGTNSATDTNVIAEPGATFTNSVKMELIKVPGGFWAGKYEVTQKEYQEIMGANPSVFTGDTLPVNNITWNEAVDFCDKLTAWDQKKRKLPAGYRYTLPTEAEWTSLVGDATLDSAVTSLNGERRQAPSPVGSLAANNLGLFDVRGNVMEFILSDASQPYRILKGGSWQDFTAINLRPEFRWYCKTDEAQNTFGLRCLLKASGQ
jgi:formylglycine-generating enzyme required for sulfatase activity